MSQISTKVTASSMGAVLTLTGNSGGPVSPDGGGNINVVGGSNINTVGTLNTLTINVTGAVLSLHGDQGPITTASNVLVTTNDGVNGGTAFFISSTSQVQLVFSDLVQNTAIGSGSVQAGRGSQNSAFGASSLDSLTSGTNNTAIGFQAGNGIDNGDFNISIGAVSNTQLTSGSYNIAIGYLAGNLWGVGASSSNIAISNAGVVSESNVIRIGTTGSGNHQQNKCFIAGTYGITPGVSSPKPVIMDSSGQLGTITTTNHAVQIGNAGGNFSSISVGTNGQVLLGATGADPAFATLTSGDGSVIFTPGPNSLDLSASGSGSGIITLMGNSGSATGSTVTITTGSSDVNGTPVFTGSGSTLTQTFDDASKNLFIGTSAGNDTYTCVDTVGIGSFSGNSITSGSYNSMLGVFSGINIVSAQQSLCLGYSAGSFLAGTGNIAIGYSAGGGGSTGTPEYNIGIGFSAGPFSSGAYNIVLGYNAGQNYVNAESSNIVINNIGTATESNVLRIGSGTGSGNQEINASFISGIYGITPGVGSPLPVFIDSNGQLGTGGGTLFLWNQVTLSSANMAINNGYVSDNVGLVTLTLPVTAAFGTIVWVAGQGAGGWQIAQNAGQNITFDGTPTTTGTMGYLASTVQYDSVQLLCIVADTTWSVITSIGNITIH